MAKFKDPPLRSPMFDKAVKKDEPGLMSTTWQRHLVDITNRLTQPNIPFITAPPVTGARGDLRTDGNFLYVCVADTPAVVWKKTVLV